MIAVNHALTGAIIGLTLTNPIIALPAAFFSHFVCDMIPHYGRTNDVLKTRGFALYLLIDAAACGLLVLLLFLTEPTTWLVAAVAAFLAASPDFLWIRKFVGARHNKEYNPTKLEQILADIQWFQRPIGVVVEVAWLIGASVLLGAYLW